MTMLTLTRPFHLPLPLLGGSVLSTLGSPSLFVFNGANDKAAFYFQAPSTACPDKAQWCITAFTTGSTLTASIEPLSGGLPSGTAVAGSNAVGVAITGIATVTVSGLAGTAILTRGAWYALVLTAAGTPNYQVQMITGTANGGWAMPNWASKDSAGSWQVFDNTNSGLCCGLFYAGDVPLVDVGHAGAYTTCAFEAYSTATNPNERGNRFQFAIPVRLSGVALLVGYGSAYAAGEDWEVRLYTDPFGTPVPQRLSASMEGQRTALISRQTLWADGPYDVAANQAFGLAVKATGAGSIQHVRWTYAAALDLRVLTGSAQQYAITRHNLTGVFTPQVTQFYGIVPIISGLDDGAGGSPGGGGMHLVGAGGLAG